MFAVILSSKVESITAHGGGSQEGVILEILRELKMSNAAQFSFSLYNLYVSSQEIVPPTLLGSSYFSYPSENNPL